MAKTGSAEREIMVLYSRKKSRRNLIQFLSNDFAFMLLKTKFSPTAQNK